MKISLVITVLNEEKTIQQLLLSIFQQTQKPEELIIVDGGSRDKTVKLIKDFKTKFTVASIIRIIKANGANRPEGRNLGIKHAKNEIIAITDAGCILDKNWLAEITAPFKNQSVEVVCGYYKSQAVSIFAQCVAVYTLVMPDKINPAEFLPATRSMAIRKKVWRAAGGFPQHFPLNEDYVFSQRLKKQGRKFYFAKKAIVFWRPRENLPKTFLMFYNFARGDSRAGIFRPKVILVLLRYLLGLLLLAYFFYTKSDIILNTLYILLIFYVLWAIVKNYKYVKHWQAIFYLPILQFAADLAVLTGTITGVFDAKT